MQLFALGDVWTHGMACGRTRLETTARRALFGCAALLLSIACAACSGAANSPLALPVPDGQMFAMQVYPLLLRDCAFASCHGSSTRFLQVFGPGRTRLDPTTTGPNDPMLLTEVSLSYERARSMLATGATAGNSLLLTKPLAVEAGGQAHRGADDFGRNVFQSPHDPEFQTLLEWGYSTGGPPTQADVDAAIQAANQAVSELQTEVP